MSKILYVDDDSDDRDLFLEALSEINIGIECLLARDGVDAVQMLADGARPARIYIDINMPKMNGLQLLRALKVHPVYSQIPAFILSTSITPAERMTARSLGAADCFVKPNSLLGLKTLIATGLRQYA